MSTIGGDSIRATLELARYAAEAAAARAAEMARRLAASLEERNAQSAQEMARVLTEAARLSDQERATFLNAAAGPSEGGPRELAERVRERIAEAYPEGSDRRRQLGAALVSVEGGEAGALAPGALEEKASRAIARLLTLTPPVPDGPADTMERRRDFGPFGASAAPSVWAGGEEPTANVAHGLYRIGDLIGDLHQGVAPTASFLRDQAGQALGDLPEKWRAMVARAREVAPGLTKPLVSMGQAEGAVTRVSQGRPNMGEPGLWARARIAAGGNALERIAARMEGLCERVGGALEVATTTVELAARARNLATVAREARGEAALVRQDMGRVLELLPGAEGGPDGSDAGLWPPDGLERAEREMRAADYGLEAFAAQQDVVAGAAHEQEIPNQGEPTAEMSGDVSGPVPGEAPPALTPEMITPEVIEELRASGQVPAEVLAQLESGDITPELLAQLQGGGPGRITQEELNRIGTGLTEAPPAQGFWNLGTVGAGMDPAFNSEEYSRAAGDAVHRVMGSSTTVRPIEGAELAAAIRDMGVPLEQVDPNQLQAAVSYINTGASGAVAEFGRGAPQTVDEQRERLALALRQVRYLAEKGPAPMDRKTAIEVMWSAARIPGHAFEKLSDAEVLGMAQQTAAATNTPGNHEWKVGRHTVKLTIGEGGVVESSSTKPPSFWSTLGKIANVALTVCSFIPGPVGLVARGVQAGIALVNAVRNGGGFLDILAAGASFVGSGAAAVGRLARAGSSVARVAGNVARVANAVSGVARGVQGIQRGGIGGILSGAAGVLSGVAGGLQGAGVAQNSSLDRFAGDLSSVGRNLGRVGAGVSAAEGYLRANRAVSDSREALEQARASGDPAQVRQAEERLAEAERGKRSAVLGGMAAVGQIAGDTLARNSAGQTEARPGEVPALGRSSFQVGAEIFSRGMNAARGINERDFLTAGVEALGGVAAAQQGTKPIERELVMGPDGRPVPVTDGAGIPIPGRFQTRDDFDPFNQASGVLDGLNDWRGAERGEGQARAAVDRAEDALGLARASGNPEAIREAEAGLRQARQGLVQADLGSNLALDNAAQRFTGATETYQNSRAADRYTEDRQEAIAALQGSSQGTARELEQLIAGSRPGGGGRLASQTALADLRTAQGVLQAAEAAGDEGRIRAAFTRLRDAEAVALAARDQTGSASPAFAALRSPLADLPSPPVVAEPASYRVRPGDNPTVIAARITAERAAQGLPGISAQDILEANGLTEASARTLKPDQALTIPGETRHANLVITPEQLQQQRFGARDTRDANVRVGTGESLERYAEMLGVKDRSAWIAEVRRRNPQLSVDGRIYEGQLLDLPPAESGARLGMSSTGGATRELVPSSASGDASGPGARGLPPSAAQGELSPEQLQQRRFAAEDTFTAITRELDSWWEDTDAIESRLSELSWTELQDLKAVARDRGVDLQQMIIDNIQTDADRDRLVAHLAGDHRAAGDMGLRQATEDVRGGFFPPTAEDRERLIERMGEASDPVARARAIELLEEQAKASEAQAGVSRQHGLDDTKDREQRAAADRTWVEQAREADSARSEVEALRASQDAEWERLRAGGGTAEQARALSAEQDRQRQALFTGHQADQAAFQFRRAVESGDRAGMQRILDSVADPDAFARTYAGRYVPGLLPSQLDHAGHFIAEQIRPFVSTPELDRARASLEGDTLRRDAHRISAALDANLGIAPDFATIQDIQRTSTPDEWRQIQQEVESLRGRSLAAETQQMMRGVEGVGRSFFGTTDLIASNQMATGTYDVHARIQHAAAGLGTNNELLMETLQSADFQALPNDQKLRYREELLGGALPELTGIDALHVDFALRGDPRTPQEALQRRRAITEMEGSNVIHDGLRWLDDSPLGRTLATTFPATAGLVAAGRGVDWYLSDQRDRMDRSVAEVDRFLAQVGDDPLNAAQQLEYNRLAREIEQSTGAYAERRDQLANYAGLAATTVVGVGATIASGGTLAPALLAFTAAGGAAANAGVRYAIRGSSTSLEDFGRDAVTGAVGATTTVVGGSVGYNLRAGYVASRGGEAALSFTQRATAGFVAGAPDGFIGGAASGFTNTALADGTFRGGFAAGLGRSLQGGLEGGVSGGLVGGAVGTMAGGVVAPARSAALDRAMGEVRPPARQLLDNEGVLIDQALGLQSRRAGAGFFWDAALGSHGDAATKYLWTIDERGINIALERTPFPTPRGNIVHTNLSSRAYVGGEAWFTGSREVVINAGSGRFGYGAGASVGQWRAAIAYWQSLGYKVRVIPFSKR